MSATIEGRQIQQRSRDRVAAIEAAALEHLREVGVRRFSTRVVADMCGSSVGVIYRYWPDTEALIEAIAPGACRAWEAVAPEWFTSYSDTTAPTFDGHRIRRAQTFDTRDEAVTFAATVANPRLHYRTRAVPEGPMVEIELPQEVSTP